MTEVLNKIYILFSHSVHFLWRKFRILYRLDSQGPIPNLCFSSPSGTWRGLFCTPGFCSSSGCGTAEERTSVLPPFPATLTKENIFTSEAPNLFLSAATHKTHHQMKGFACVYVIGRGGVTPSPAPPSTIEYTILPNALQPTWIFRYAMPQEKKIIKNCQA